MSNYEQIVTAEPFAEHFISQGFRVGDLLYLSGQLSVDDNGEIVAPGDFDGQVDQIFKNIENVLIAGGSSLDDVVMTRVYLCRDADRPAVPKFREKYFSKPYPASTVLVVDSFSRPEYLLELEVVAAASAH